MKNRSLRSLGVAVTTGQVAAVFVEGNEVVGWCRSAQAYHDTEKAKQLAAAWVHQFCPDQTMIEDKVWLSRKGPQSRLITKTVAEVFAAADCNDLRVTRTRLYDNKYDEAEALADQFPTIRSILPKRPPIWLPQPRDMAYFAALSLIAAVVTSERSHSIS